MEFEEDIVDSGYELDRKGLFSAQNWEVSRYLETFSNLSVKAPTLPLFMKEGHQKMKLVKYFTTQKINSWIFSFLFQSVFGYSETLWLIYFLQLLFKV